MFGFLFWLVLSLILEGVSYMIWPEDYTFTWQGSSFIILLVISVFLLPIQTSFEELFFRIYEQQGAKSAKKNLYEQVSQGVIQQSQKMQGLDD